MYASLRHKILDEAIGILHRDGVERITMRALARALDYSPATLYLHFRSKEELLREIAIHGFERLEEAIEASAQLEGALEAVANCMRRYIDFGLANPQLYSVMFSLPVASYSERELAHFDLLWAFGQSLHARGIKSGAFGVRDAEAETTTTWATMHGFLQLALSERLPLPTREERGSLLLLRDAVIEGRVRGLRA